MGETCAWGVRWSSFTKTEETWGDFCLPFLLLAARNSRGPCDSLRNKHATLRSQGQGVNAVGLNVLGGSAVTERGTEGQGKGTKIPKQFGRYFGWPAIVSAKTEAEQANGRGSWGHEDENHRAEARTARLQPIVRALRHRNFRLFFLWARAFLLWAHGCNALPWGGWSITSPIPRSFWGWCNLPARYRPLRWHPLPVCWLIAGIDIAC